MRKLPSGHGWAYLGVVLGLAGSVIGNVANTVLTPSGVPLGLRVPFASAWPVFLGIGIEVLTRIDWKAGWKHWAARALLVGPMSLVAGFMSYLHLHHLMVMSGEPGLAQLIGPIGVDGTLFGCTVALLVTRGAARHAEDQPASKTLAERVASLRTAALDVKAAAAGTQDPKTQDQDAPAQVPAPETQDSPVATEDRAPETQDLPATQDPTEVRTQRGSVDYAKVLRAVLENAKDQDVADLIGVSAKTAQRVRRVVKLLGTTEDLAAIAATVKLAPPAVKTIAEELKR